MTGMRYNSLLWMCTLNTLTWLDLTWPDLPIQLLTVPRMKRWCNWWITLQTPGLKDHGWQKCGIMFAKLVIWKGGIIKSTRASRKVTWRCLRCRTFNAWAVCDGGWTIARKWRYGNTDARICILKDKLISQNITDMEYIDHIAEPSHLNQ